MLIIGRIYFGGLDPAGSVQRPSGCALIDDALRVVGVARLFTDKEILAFFSGYKENLAYLGLDGPCGLPQGLGLCCFDPEVKDCPCRQTSGEKGRIAEMELARRGIGCFFTTKKAFAKAWVRRSLEFYRMLTDKGFRILEIYPYGAKRRLFSGKMPKKVTRLGREVLQRGLRRLGLRFPGREILSHHELDALLGAYTCYLHSRGLTEEVGEEVEGRIVIPAIGIPGIGRCGV